MASPERPLPLHQVTLVLGILSILLAFARHLVSLALVVGLLACALGSFALWRAARSGHTYTAQSMRHARRGRVLAAIGVCISVVLWILWAQDRLPL